MILKGMKLTRFDIRKTRASWNYVYGESLRAYNDDNDRTRECRGEPNCFGVTVCRCFDLKPDDRIFKPAEFETIREIIKRDIHRIPQDKATFFFADIGDTDNSLMRERTPELYDYMATLLIERFPLWKKYFKLTQQPTA